MLAEEFKAKAKAELREDELRKSQALEQFRDWIAKQGHIRSCRTGSMRINSYTCAEFLIICILDDDFLLRFLRVKKYSNADAFRMLEKFLLCCRTHPVWFHNLTFDDQRMRELFESGYIFPLTERDGNGCRVIMIQANKLDLKKFTFSDVLKIINLVIFTLLEEPETQIAGFVYVIDHKDISFDYVSLFSLTDMHNYLKCIQSAIPCRQKLGIFVNLPSYAVRLTDFGKALVSNKLKERALFYKDIEKIYEHVAVSILPKEYGGLTPIAEMMATFRTVAEARKDRLRQIDEQQIDIEGVKERKVDTIDSFRKLEID